MANLDVKCQNFTAVCGANYEKWVSVEGDNSHFYYFSIAGKGLLFWKDDVISLLLMGLWSAQFDHCRAFGQRWEDVE